MLVAGQGQAGVTERAAEDRAAAKSSAVAAPTAAGGGALEFFEGTAGGERRVARLGREFGEHREGVDAEVNEGEECVGRERKSEARRRAFGRGSGPRGWDIR